MRLDEQKVLLTIENYDELLALHKTLMIAKFAEDPVDKTLIGSAYVADILNRTTIALADYEKSHFDDDKRSNWTNWRKITSSHIQWDCISKEIKSISSTETWNSWNKEKRLEYLRIVSSPFILDENQIKKLLNSGSEF